MARIRQRVLPVFIAVDVVALEVIGRAHGVDMTARGHRAGHVVGRHAVRGYLKATVVRNGRECASREDSADNEGFFHDLQEYITSEVPASRMENISGCR